MLFILIIATLADRTEASLLYPVTSPQVDLLELAEDAFVRLNAMDQTDVRWSRGPSMSVGDTIAFLDMEHPEKPLTTVRCEPRGWAFV